MLNKLYRFLKELRISLVIRRSGMFDRSFYLRNNLDVARSCMDPIRHYVFYGWREGRNPSPYFDTKGYLKKYPDVARADINPLYHYLKHGILENRDPFPKSSQCSPSRINLKVNLPTKSARLKDQSVSTSGKLRLPALPGSKRSMVYDGICQKRHGFHTILLCSHYVGKHHFGGERSFIDVLEELFKLGYDIVVSLPGYHQQYIAHLSSYAYRVYVLPYKFWSDEACDSEIVKEFEKIIETEEISVVHVNTIMVREPLMAARNKNVPSITHVRELITGDEELANSIQSTKDKIIRSVIERTDYIIANSETTSRVFMKPQKTFIVPNTVDMKAFDLSNNIDDVQIRVAVISSNIPKKGIYDFIQIAQLCQARLQNVKFLLIGPDNEYIRKLKIQQKNGNIPSNIVFAGYIESPVKAIMKTNIIVNVSNFSESFGRTVLEAMAARRPVVAYDYGAVPELIEDGVNGFLVPYKDVAMAARKIEELCTDISRIKEMGMAGRKMACSKYSPGVFREKLQQAYTNILQDSKQTVSKDNLPGAWSKNADRPAKAPCQFPSKISVIIPNYNYFNYLKERINSVINQTLCPFEIIFLDDASSDDSIAVAQEMLSRSCIPFKIIVNETNKGVYKQWIRGIKESQGDYVWIAEADDTCDPEFLETLAETMTDKHLVLTYCQSRIIDKNGNILRTANLFHTNDLDPERWKKNYQEIGIREVVDCLWYRNTIPNISACLIRKTALQDIEILLDEFKYCGDWLLHGYLLSQGNLSFVSQPLNSFRRHNEAVTRSRGKSVEYLCELIKIKSWMAERFPIHHSQIKRMIYFLDKDYAIEGVSRNSDYPVAAGAIKEIAQKTIDRKRIVFTTTNNGSFNGGSEVLWIETAKKMRRQGHDVIVLIKNWKPAPGFFEEFKTIGIRCYFKEEEGFKPIHDFDPDLAVFSLGDQDEGTEWFEQCISRSIPYVIVNQLTKEEAYWPIRKDKNDAVRKGYLGAAGTFFTCRNNIEVMEKRIGCSIPGASVHFNPFHLDRDTCIPYPSTQEGLHLAIPSRLLMIHKGQHLVIEVLKEKRWQNRNITVNCYGDGPDEQYLRSLVDKYEIRNVHFYTRQQSIIDIWKSNHAILMPSFMEGLPIVLVGAMVCARVPIVTDIGGHREVIEDNVTGFIAAKPSVTSIDEAMERAFEQRDKWEEMGRKAREKILAYLPEDPVDDFILKLISIKVKKRYDETKLL